MIIVRQFYGKFQVFDEGENLGLAVFGNIVDAVEYMKTSQAKLDRLSGSFGKISGQVITESEMERSR